MEILPDLVKLFSSYDSCIHILNIKDSVIALNRIKGIKGVLRDLFNFFIRPFLESFAKPPDKGYHQNERIIRPRPVFTTSLERRYRCDNVKTHYHYINPCHHSNLSWTYGVWNHHILVDKEHSTTRWNNNAKFLSGHWPSVFWPQRKFLSFQLFGHL